jgi:hypothetical protein
MLATDFLLDIDHNSPYILHCFPLVVNDMVVAVAVAKDFSLARGYGIEFEVVTDVESSPSQNY